MPPPPPPIPRPFFKIECFHSFCFFVLCVKGIDVMQFRPVKLTEGDKLYAVGQNMTVAGWGTTALNGPTPGVLLEASVPFVPEVECAKIYGSYLTGNMFCAGGATKDACQGDSGGPIFVVATDGTVEQVSDPHFCPQNIQLETSP